MALLCDAPCRMLPPSYPWLFDGAWYHTNSLMMTETDLPCADCGTDLVERTNHTRELPVSTSWHGTVQLAECPLCDARYYPDRALSRLARSRGTRHAGGTANH